MGRLHVLVLALLPVLTAGVEVLYFHKFDSNSDCSGEPSETYPIALINQCFVSCTGNVPRHETMDSYVCGVFYSGQGATFV